MGGRTFKRVSEVIGKERKQRTIVVMDSGLALCSHDFIPGNIYV